jgi:general secretion pathway protein D
VVTAAFFLSACNAAGPHNPGDPEGGDITGAISHIDLRPRASQPSPTADTGSASASPVSFLGSTSAATKEVGASNAAALDSKDGVTLNFENAPVAAVAKVILGDVMGVNYTIDPHAQGSVTLASGRPVAKKDLPFVLENALRSDNLVMVKTKLGFNIQPANGGPVGGVDRAGDDSGSEAGYGIMFPPARSQS